jgi:hypothetical protein
MDVLKTAEHVSRCQAQAGQEEGFSPASRLASVAAGLTAAFVERIWGGFRALDASLQVSQYHITRPLAPPYIFHTVLLKVESYNDAGVRQGEGLATETLFQVAGAAIGLALRNLAPKQR